jgi:hypothetical protein
MIRPRQYRRKDDPSWVSKHGGDMAATAEMTLEMAPKEVREAQARYDKVQKAIRQLEKHVRKDPNGKFELKVKNAKDAGVDPEIFDELKQSLELGNQYAQQGLIQSNEIAETTLEQGIGAQHASLTNHTHFYWWGVQIYMNDRTTHDLLAGIQASTAAITTILVAVGVTAVFAPVIAAALFLLAGLVYMIDSWGGHRGIVISSTWIGGVTLWHQ